MKETAGNRDLKNKSLLKFKRRQSKTELNRTKNPTRNEQKTRAKIQTELTWQWGKGD